MNYQKMTAPCGLDCFNCQMWLASKDDNLRKTISENYGIPYNMAVCKGCRAHGGQIPFLGMKEPCNVYKCITAKGVEICSDCDEFPCDHLHPYADKAGMVPHNTKVFNLCLIKKMGLESWAEDKAAQVKKTYFGGVFKL
ncbi:DUF3795 domain-containing protein [Dethiosulfatarculus sandiegensis]|uniref:DUF3795 domain-containing protein n=1 Tax=Dethiosulfatarculus sandiegensis TaxID=1429043 RepID=A0A0D2GCU8_9BACT|nr:DUF3795 domain-containing protein [Dethiosulfatarculus sandiegensis]KIX12792.1 hypothetical protein X474_17330 [Dethiosulfatarculus sandiegensis]